MIDLFILGSQQVSLGGGLEITKQEVGNALAMAIGIIAFAFLCMGRIGKMFGFLIVGAIVWVVIGDPKSFLTAIGNLIKSIVGL